MRQVSIYPAGYEADEGKVFDWITPHYDEGGNQIHLYSPLIYLGIHDTIYNYTEVDKPEDQI